jgi:hypothetical protein
MVVRTGEVVVVDRRDSLVLDRSSSKFRAP